MTWNPMKYLRFAPHRLRPGLELLARVPDVDARTAVDLGCGTGELTAALATRFPLASVEGLDASPVMLGEARKRSGAIRWLEADIGSWRPDRPIDIVYSNAALQWLDDHEGLFSRLAHWVAPGGVLAVQMPDNWNEPTHLVPRRILDEGAYGDPARRALLRDRVATPADYRRWVGPEFEADMWTTVYHHVLSGPDPVLEWVSGSVLRPVLERLEEPDRRRFLAACARGYRSAYPPGTNGTTVLPFRRFFLVAHRR